MSTSSARCAGGSAAGPLGLERYLEYRAITSRSAAHIGRAIKQPAAWAEDHAIGATPVVAVKDGQVGFGPGRARERRRPQHVDHAAARVRCRETGVRRRPAGEGRTEERAAARRVYYVVRGKHAVVGRPREGIEQTLGPGGRRRRQLEYYAAALFVASQRTTRGIPAKGSRAVEHSGRVVEHHVPCRSTSVASWLTARAAGTTPVGP